MEPPKLSGKRPVLSAEFRGNVRISAGAMPTAAVITRAVVTSVESMLPYIGAEVTGEALALYMLMAVSSSSISSQRVLYGGNGVATVMEAGSKRCVITLASGPESEDIKFMIDAPKRFLFYYTSNGTRTEYSGDGVFSVSILLERGIHMMRACHVDPEWVPATIVWPQYAGTIYNLFRAVFRG